MIQKLSISIQKKQKRHAFTLVEIMFVVAILGIIGIVLTSFIVDSAKSMLWSVNKSLITKSFREFTLQLSQDSFNAGNAYLYRSFDSGDSNDPSDRRGLLLSGDCLVLISTAPFPTNNSPRFYQRIVVYYRESDGGDPDRSTVLRRQIDFPDGSIPAITPVETVLTAQRNNFSEAETVVDRSRGLSNEQLFLSLSETTFLINGEIIFGENAQRITNTYNLTISTRG